jgi:DNA-binding SARP family transcriptional activator
MVQLPMARTCAVRLLGGFQVAVEGRPVAVEAWRHRRGADLVKLLALAPQHSLHRDQVMDQLWPELAADPSAANLRKAVHYARRALGGMDAVDADGDMVRLWPSGELRIDSERFESESGRALADESGYDSALRLFTGELLPEDRYADWTEPHRTRLRQRHLELLRATGRWEEVLEVDRTDEVACRALMRAHLEKGNRHDAIREFQRLREVLRVDLGVAPEPATVALFEKAVATEGPEPASASERAQALLARGLMQWSDQELVDAQQTAEEARTLATVHHLYRELGEASALLGMVAMARGQWLEVFRRDFIAALELHTDQSAYLYEAHLCLSEATLTGGDARATSEFAHELLDRAIDARSAEGEALMCLFIGVSEFFSGRLDPANDWLTRAADLYARKGGFAFAVTQLHRAELIAAREGPSHATALLLETQRLAADSPLAPHLQPRVLELMIKDSEGSKRRGSILGEAEALMARPKGICRPCSIGLAVAASIASSRAGELARSRYWLGHAERLAGLWSGGPWQAAVWEARAALRTAEGDRKQAQALLREAGDLFAQSGRPLDEARCRAAIPLG